MLIACQRVLEASKVFSEEELNHWTNFLKQFPLAEVHYAFEKWTNSQKWLPKPGEIRELCDEYRFKEMEKTDREQPTGCERCDWTGFYTVTRRSSVERLVASCPCRTNVGLRTPCTKQRASIEDIRWMYAEIKKLCESKDMNKAIGKPKQISGIIPTTNELAEQLSREKKHVQR